MNEAMFPRHLQVWGETALKQSTKLSPDVSYIWLSMDTSPVVWIQGRQQMNINLLQLLKTVLRLANQNAQGHYDSLYPAVLSVYSPRGL